MPESPPYSRSIRTLTSKHICHLALPSSTGSLPNQNQSNIHPTISSNNSYYSTTANNVTPNVSNSNLSTTSSIHSSYTVATTKGNIPYHASSNTNKLIRDRDRKNSANLSSSNLSVLSSNSNTDYYNTTNPSPSIHHHNHHHHQQQQPNISTSIILNPNTASFASPTHLHLSSPLNIAFQQFLIIPTSDSYVHIYSIQEDDDELLYTSNSSSITKSRRFNNYLDPIYSLGPFHVATASTSNVEPSLPSNNPNTEQNITNIPSTIIATTSISTCYLLDKNIIQTTTTATTVMGETSTDPNTTQSKTSWNVYELGYIAILTLEGDVHIYRVYSLSCCNNDYTSHDTYHNNTMNIQPPFAQLKKYEEIFNASPWIKVGCNSSSTSPMVTGGSCIGGDILHNNEDHFILKEDMIQYVKFSLVTSFSTGYINALSMHFHHVFLINDQNLEEENDECQGDNFYDESMTTGNPINSILTEEKSVATNDKKCILEKRLKKQRRLCLAIGHECGTICDYELVGSCAHQDKEPTEQSSHSPELFTNSLLPSHENLKWKCAFDSPIQSISTLGGEEVIISQSSSIDDTGIDDLNINWNDLQLRSQYLVVGLRQSEGNNTNGSINKNGSDDRQLLSSYLEVINIDNLTNEWINRNKEMTASTAGGKTISTPISIESFCLWPELDDVSSNIDDILSGDSRKGNLPYNADEWRHTHRHGSSTPSEESGNIGLPHAAHMIRSFPSCANPGFVVGFTSGSVITFHTDNSREGISKSSNNKLSWGALHADNQIKFDNPCIGFGVFDLSHSWKSITGARGASANKDDYSSIVTDVRKETCQQSIVCCLRGGTVFVIPIISSEQQDDNSSHIRNEIKMYQLHGDLSEVNDGLTRYTQGFTAGYIIARKRLLMPRVDGSAARTIQVKSQLKPLFFHAWAGGIIDVSCPTFPNETDCTNNNINQSTTYVPNDLVRNRNIIESLVSLILSFDNDDGDSDPTKVKIEDSLILSALEECKLFKTSMVDDIVSGMISKFPSFAKFTEYFLSGGEFKSF